MSFHLENFTMQCSRPHYSLDALFLLWNTLDVSWDIEYTDEFGGWWNSLSVNEQESVRASLILLEENGPNLRAPHSSGIATSKHPHMRELRIQHAGHPHRVLYAFDPLQTALLLIGG